MGNTLKRFLSNKNTVTLLAILVCVVLVYAVYSWRLKSAVQTTTVCVASQTIPARTAITEDMLSTTKVCPLTALKTLSTSSLEEILIFLFLYEESVDLNFMLS